MRLPRAGALILKNDRREFFFLAPKGHSQIQKTAENCRFFA